MTDTERTALKYIFDERRFKLIVNDIANVWRPFDVERFFTAGFQGHD
jgi:hypothetical protein